MSDLWPYAYPESVASDYYSVEEGTKDKEIEGVIGVI